MSDSLITKKAIASALKKLCQTKPFDKISIADITESCGLNRQSFYYHFQDKYELLNWIYYNEGFVNVTDGINFSNWSNRLLQLLQTMQKDKLFYMNTIKSQDSSFEEYLCKITHTLFYDAIEKLDTHKDLSEDHKNFYAQFYAFGICGVVASWAKDGMKTPPEQVSEHLKSLALQSEKLAFERYMDTRL
ncbi:dihydroxyacetone kinase transcriptional activator DhaS [Oscillospiraceae bacterium PP1C4]